MVGLKEKEIYDISNDIADKIHTKAKISQTTDTDGFLEQYFSRIKTIKINIIIKDL